MVGDGRDNVSEEGVAGRREEGGRSAGDAPTDSSDRVGAPSADGSTGGHDGNGRPVGDGGPVDATGRRGLLRRVGAAATLPAVAVLGADLAPSVHGVGADYGAAEGSGASGASPRVDESMTDVRGAVYFPARAFNAYQTWRDYDRAVVERDLSYARRLRLDGLRTIISYEFHREDPDAFERRFEHFLAAADDAGIGVVPVLFESIGDQPTREHLTDRDLRTATAVRSPHGRTVRNRRRWDGPREFVTRFAERFGDRDALLALEIMNEPGRWRPRVAFCRAMLRAARAADDRVPLTMGCRDLAFNRQYRDPPLDVFQTHLNLPPTPARMHGEIDRAERATERTGRPVWISEWQRTREEPPDVLLPNYASLVPTLRERDVAGDFFWSLMLKPAYMARPRKRGRLNGVFHEDGAVFSAADARAIVDGSSADWTGADPGTAAGGSTDPASDALASADPTSEPGGTDAMAGGATWVERQTWPAWARAVAPDG